MSSFTGKVAIVTGCSSGIGLSTVSQLIQKGCLVFGVDVADLQDEGLIEQAKGENFAFYKADLTQTGACDTSVESCKARFGPRIDILVNVAGIVDGWSSADTITDKEWNQVMAINLNVPVNLMRAVLPSMKQNGGGAIVNVCSKASFSGASAGIAYTASKHALAGVTKNVAWRFHKEGIRCNAVCPGGVTTNIGKSLQMEYFDPLAFQVFQPVFQLHVANDENGIPKTHISPEDVAHGIIFLASSEAKMINGAFLPIDTAWSTI